MARIVLTIQANNEATASVKALNAEIKVLSQTLSSITVNKNLTAQINALTKHYTALANAQAKITAASNKQAISDEKLRQQQARTATQIANAAAAQARLEKAQQTTAATTDQLQKKFANLLSTIKSIKNAYPEGTFTNIEQSVRANLQAAKDGSKSVEELGKAYSALSKDVAIAKAETDKVTTAVVKSGDSIGSLAKKFFLWQITATLVMAPLRLIQNALKSINETLVKTEDAVIALQRVLPKGSATDNEISSRLYKVAQDYGQTFENVSEIATNFARSGMSWADTIKATEAAVLALNVAELDAEEATNGLIAILSQFHLTASDLEDVIDKLNKTADNFPVTTQKILAALQRTGSAADNANLSLNQTIALITALSKATGRSGENIGTALNSLIQYSRKDSALETFAALSDESAEVVANFRKGMLKDDGTVYTILDVWRQVSKEIKNIKAEQADLLDQYFNTEDGESLQEALDGELQDIYTELGGVYDTANTFRKNYFIALLGNMDTVEEALGTLGEASGYSQKENEKYLETYTAKLNSLKAQWQDLANDEQGILGLKKNLVDIGSVILNVINHTGKLTTIFLLFGAVINKLIGAKLAQSLATYITSLSHISRTINAQATPAVLNYTAAIRRLKGEILTTVDSEALLTKQTELLALKQQRLASVMKGASTALSVGLIFFSALSAIQGAIDQAEADRIAEEQEALQKTHEKISASLESVEANKELAQSTIDYAVSVEELRKTLESSTATESEKQSAQAQLLSIQNSLIDSNNDYAKSLDLVNGNLTDQLKLVKELSDEQLRQQAKNFLDENFGQKSDIDKIVGQGKTNVELTNGNAFDNDKNKRVIQNLIDKAKEQGIELGLDSYVNVPTAWTTPITWLEEIIRKTANGQKTTVWDWLGFTAVKDAFSAEGWEGSSWAGLSVEGTLEEQINKLQATRDLLVQNYEAWGITKEEAEAYVNSLDDALSQLNSEENQNAIAWQKKYQAAEDFFNHKIDAETFVERFYGITKATADETEDWHNNIAKVTDKYDDLIDKLEALRDANKESLELEEKKQAVLDAQAKLAEKENELLERQNDLIRAQQALENARNEATVRRFNQTKQQWEWQVDEKKVAEAEENVKKAEENVQKAQEDILKAQEDIQKSIRDLEKQAYDTIIDQLKNNTATNDGLNELLDGLREFLGEDFIRGIKNAILVGSNVDLDKPINDGKPTNGSNGPQGGGGGTGGGGGNSSFSRVAYAYDSGGVASGTGFMAKATDRDELILNPDLTQQILTPVSNERFHQFVKDLGLMFENQHNFQSQPVIERVGGNTDNRVNNSGQVFIRDVNVGAERRDDLLGILRLAPLTSKN